MSTIKSETGKKVKLTKVCLAYDPTYPEKKILRFCFVNSFKTKVIFIKDLKKVYNINEVRFAPCKMLYHHNYYYEVLDMLKPNETKMPMNKLKYCDKKFEKHQLKTKNYTKVEDLLSM